MGNKKYDSDFTLKGSSDGKAVYWEHFGRMDSETYAQKTSMKLTVYAAHHIFAWKNLICTYEEDIQDMRKINQIIDIMLL